ncbi:glycosyltransferase [Acetobacteraceae bacterium KSS8]|uniref:Glycosyltransferase n=1 Tax=Endosaccharibacter trunci TaxID=2812733 RepID=A0ABT1W4F2_9PROT|nr:glycosyltransferase [Acetobacteraceae bacterium KSS8]
MTAAPLLRVLVWQWGRFGAGPRVGAELAAGLNALDGCEALLSLSTGAEIMRAGQPWRAGVALPVATYRNRIGFALRMIGRVLRQSRLRRRVAALRPDVAICAMPGPLDGEMASVLRALGVPFLVMVHDADRHPGDGFALQMVLQRRLIRRSSGLVALSAHVAARLEQQKLVRNRPLLISSLPPFVFGSRPPAPLSHGGGMRLLFFGRLLPYKGLDLLADALERGMPDGLSVRIVGQGPDCPELDRLAALPGVSVENRWVPEDEIGTLIAWADALVLPYREASQSGVAAAAIAARRWVVSTRVGGLAEQFRDEPMAILCEPEAGALRAAIAQMVRKPPALAAAPEDPYAAWGRTAAVLLEGIRRVVSMKREAVVPTGR